MSIYGSVPPTIIVTGPKPHVQAAIAAAEVPVGHQHRVGAGKSFRAICDLLTNLPQRHAEETADLIAPGAVDSVRARIARIRAAMAAELDAADRYVASVYDALGLEEED